MAQHVIDIAEFRASFAEFANPIDFTDAQLQMYWDMATNYIKEFDNCLVNGRQLQHMLNLMTAHLLKSFSIMSTGGLSGVTASASEGSVSVSVTPPPSKSGWQYWLATTPYGLQLWALMTMLTMGGFYVGGSPERSGFRNSHGHF